jgi:hypothetical protein
MQRLRARLRNAAPHAARLKALAAAAALLASLVLLPDQAFGDNCLDRVEQMAAAYGTSTDPPTIPPGEMKKPVTPDDLARSGGVVEPPTSPDRSVITPPRDHSGMPTMPDVARPQSKDKDARAHKLGPAGMSTLQAVLMAARAQAERGMEAECLDGLRKAEQLIAHAR